MRKLLSSPVQMPLSDAENQVYQNALKYITPLSLNLMAVKVTHRPDDFLDWCRELIRLCREELNKDLLEDEQTLPLKKLQDILETGFTLGQFKMARIAPWPIFVDFIEQQSTLHALDERLRLLSYVDEIRQKPLADLLVEDRLAFSGKHTSQHDYSHYDFDVEWFAGTKGAKVFHTLLELSPEKFDAALAHIPLTGDVSLADYQSFVSDFQQIFREYTQIKSQGEKAPLAVATRLLAMRRPDQFIALNNNKIDILCQGLSIAKFKNNDFSSYWQDMIGTLRTFAWWHQAEPEVIVESEAADTAENSESNSPVNRELILWKNRAVLIDLFLFADADLAPNSNYIRLRDKMLNKAMSKSKAAPKKRSKESAEMLVDKALTADDLPEYLLGKRDSIVLQVKNGKSVEQAIGLMRAIFG
ncbi:MAG: hypothetical protein HRT53_03985 [Colwellia sp.]|nr:hypothetical protein [Colwellia sp.]